WLRPQGSRHLGILYFCWRCSHTATEPSTRTHSPGDAGSRLGAPVGVMSHSDEGPRPDLLNTSAISAVSGSFAVARLRMTKLGMCLHTFSSRGVHLRDLRGSSPAARNEINEKFDEEITKSLRTKPRI